jgi:hypothetical protein
VLHLHHLEVLRLKAIVNDKCGPPGCEAIGDRHDVLSYIPNGDLKYNVYRNVLYCCAEHWPILKSKLRASPAGYVIDPLSVNCIARR